MNPPPEIVEAIMKTKSKDADIFAAPSSETENKGGGS